MSLAINRVLTNRLPTRSFVAIVFVVFGVCVHLFGTARNTDMMPTSIGSYWIYDTLTREQVEGGSIQTVKTKVKFTIVDSIKGDGVEAGLVERKDLSGHEPISYSARLVVDNNRFYENDMSKEDWRTLKSSIAAGQKQALPEESSLQMVLPSEVGSKWDLEGGPDRTDNMYCWCIEKTRLVQASSEIAGVVLTQETTEYTLAFRTCPDHQIKRFVPGIGFTDIQYSHHGTVSDSDEHLVEFHTGS